MNLCDHVAHFCRQFILASGNGLEQFRGAYLAQVKAIHSLRVRIRRDPLRQLVTVEFSGIHTGVGLCRLERQFVAPLRPKIGVTSASWSLFMRTYRRRPAT